MTTEKQKKICEQCGVEFYSSWSEEESIAEKDRIFGEVPLEDCMIVCEECFQVIMAQLN